MRRMALVAILAFVLLHGCVSPFGLASESECELKDRDSEKIECFHLAAVSMAHLSHSAEASASICNRITEIGSAHEPDGLIERYFDSFEDRAEVEKNNCLMDVMRATARFDESAGHICCDNIGQRRFTEDLFGAGVNQEMCNDQFNKQRQLASDVFYGSRNNLCNMAFSILALVSVAAIFIKQD